MGISRPWDCGLFSDNKQSRWHQLATLANLMHCAYFSANIQQKRANWAFAQLHICHLYNFFLFIFKNSSSAFPELSFHMHISCFSLDIKRNISMFLHRCFSRSDHLALHMKRHIWRTGRKGAGGARGGRGGAEGEIGGEIGGQKDGQPCYRLPASYPPRRPSPNPNTSRLKQPSGGKKRGVARLLFFFKITHSRLQ